MKQNQMKISGLNVLLWILQVLLAVTFLWAGYVKLFTPAEELAKMWPWTKANPGLVIAAGISDVLAGTGILLPRLLNIWPALTLYACYGIILLMFSAIAFHVSRGETSQLGINFGVLIVAAAVIFLWRYVAKRSFGKF